MWVLNTEGENCIEDKLQEQEIIENIPLFMELNISKVFIRTFRKLANYFLVHPL